MAADDSHHQPRAGARIAEIQNRVGFREPSDPGAAHAPAAWRMTFDRGAELATGLRGAQHVVALEEAVDLRFADRKEAENQGAMRGRFVAWNAHPAGERTGAFRRERPCVDRSGNGHQAFLCFAAGVSGPKARRRPRSACRAGLASRQDSVAIRSLTIWGHRRAGGMHRPRGELSFSASDAMSRRRLEAPRCHLLLRRADRTEPAGKGTVAQRSAAKTIADR